MSTNGMLYNWYASNKEPKGPMQNWFIIKLFVMC